MELPLWKVCFSYAGGNHTFMYIHTSEICSDEEDSRRKKIGKISNGKFRPKRSLIDYIVKIRCNHARYGYIPGEEIPGSDGPVFADRMWVERC